MNVSTKRESAACYLIRNGLPWAEIYVRHGMGKTGAGDPRGWVNVSVISDFGSFGYCWSHIGATPWHEFLATLDFDYAMNKFLSGKHRVSVDGHEAQRRAHAHVLRLRRERTLSKDQASALYHGATTADPDQGLSVFLSDWGRESGEPFHRFEMWSYDWKMESPAARGFWSDIWPLFVAEITAEAELRKPVTDPAKLSDLERRVLVWAAYSGGEEWAFPFRRIGEDLGLKTGTVRSACQSLARKRLMEFKRGLLDEDGMAAGSGYGCTRAGNELGRALEAREAA